MKKEIFINKHCKMSLKSGFVIDGIISDMDDFGLTITNRKTTGFFSFDEISNLKVVE